VSQLAFWTSCGYRNSKNKIVLPEFGRDPVTHGSSGLKPLRRHAPVGGYHWSMGATFLGSWGDWLWGLVSPRIHASSPTLWTVWPTRRGSDWVYHKLGNAPVQRSWQKMRIIYFRDSRQKESHESAVIFLQCQPRKFDIVLYISALESVFPGIFGDFLSPFILTKTKCFRWWWLLLLL